MLHEKMQKAFALLMYLLCAHSLKLPWVVCLTSFYYEAYSLQNAVNTKNHMECKCMLERREARIYTQQLEQIYPFWLACRAELKELWLRALLWMKSLSSENKPFVPGNNLNGELYRKFKTYLYSIFPYPLIYNTLLSSSSWYMEA